MLKTARHEVAIVGAGPVGLTMAIDLIRRGVDAIVLEERGELSEGSRAICFAKRTLEIFSRLGASTEMINKGVTWHKGKVFHRERLLYEFDLAQEKPCRHPAFINLQQYYCERHLLQRLQEIAPQALWRGWRVCSATSDDNSATVVAEAGSSETRIECDYVIACDGAKSGLRASSGISMIGEEFRDWFLISDVKMRSDFPSERWFWFDPPFHAGRSALLHKQPDNVWRIDLQLGWHADPYEERKPENVLPRLRAMLGEKTNFDLKWVSVYAFQSRRMERFDCRRIFFAGDAAHQMSPFGARGANSGIQDADNLGWKIAQVLRSGASDALLASYNTERTAAADDNILHSSRSTHFIAPPNEVAQAFRDAVLMLAEKHTFARAFVNSGRLSIAADYNDSSLNSDDDFATDGVISDSGHPGNAPPDALLTTVDNETVWLSEKLEDDFNCLVFADVPPVKVLTDKCEKRLPIKCHFIAPPTSAPSVANALTDSGGLARRRFGVGDIPAVVLLRPDGHVCGRWRAAERGGKAALETAVAVVETILKKGWLR